MLEEKQVKAKFTQKVLNTLKPALYLERCFGICRISHDGNQIGSTKSKITAIILPLAYIILFLMVFKIPLDIYDLKRLMSLVDILPYLVNTCQYCTITINTTLFLNKLNYKILLNLVLLDSMLKINMDDNRYKKFKMYTFKAVSILFILFLVFFIGDIVIGDTNFIDKLILYPVFLVREIEVMVIFIVLEMVLDRLQVINLIISEFIENKGIISIVGNEINIKRNMLFISSVSNKNTKIQELAKAYDLIGETCLLINKVFNFQMLWVLLSTFTYVVLTIGSAFYYFRDTGSDAASLISLCIWCVAEVLAIGLLALNCERILVARNDCKVLISDLIMDYELPRSMRIQSKMFMELIEAWPLSFSVYEMFSVDITLILKFISVATTYLIVIIQIFHFV